MRKFVFAALAAVLFAGCQEEDTPAQLTDPSVPVSIAFDEVKYFDYQAGPFESGLGRNYVLRTAADWSAFATPANSEVMINFPFAPTDFTNYTYLALRHDLHYGGNENAIKIGVESVIKQNDTLKVNYIKRTNGPGDILTLLNSQPCQLVRIPFSTLPVKFIQVD